MESTPLSAWLELECLDGSIAGHLTDGEGSRRAFRGWLGLVAAIDALLPPECDQQENDR